MSDPAGGEGEGRAPDEARPSLQRLDPDRAGGSHAPAAGTPEAPPPPAAPPPAAPVIDTRPYRWMVGIIGLVIVLGISVYQFASHGVGSTGVTAGHRLRYFAAPLADTNLNGDANAHPTCSAARHDPRALNVCLIAGRGPLVLSFFVTGAGQCVRQVSAMQSLAGRFPSVQFAAVAINGSHKATAALIRAHHWTIPVAYDPDGRVGAIYGVAVCPMVELAERGGVVRDRLIGDRWQTAAALAPRVQELLGGGAPAG
ncbi:MAG TPA: TlpA disulfide reductase family protein [Solirubrobacteraceae bacterium]|nr:TlpA disulfide reductase family protein [Solirubrobacteraceae bacterium]